MITYDRPDLKQMVESIQQWDDAAERLFRQAEAIPSEYKSQSVVSLMREVRQSAAAARQTYYNRLDIVRVLRGVFVP